MATALEDSGSRRSNTSLFFCYGLIVSMMVCLAFFFHQILLWLTPQTPYGYLIPFSIFVTVEAIISAHALIWVDTLSSRWLSHRFVEWIVLLVLIKLLSYFSTGFSQLAADLLLWDDRFSTFFTTEYLVGILVTAVVWSASSSLSRRLLLIFSSIEQLDLELEGINLIDRISLRRRLLGLIFTIGGLMLAILTLMRSSLDILPKEFQEAQIQYGAVLVYFIAGFILLSQTQLFVHWTRWYLRRIPTEPNIWRRWIGLSILLVAGAALIAILLPTEYSYGLLTTLQIALGYVFYFLAFLQYLLLTPILLFLNFLTNLFGMPSMDFQPPSTPPRPMAPAGEPFSEPLWGEILRSFLFWSVFFTIIFLAFRHYIRQNKDFTESLRRQPYLQWAFQFWEWLKKILNKTKGWEGLSTAVRRRGIKKASHPIAVPRPMHGYLLDNLPPRQKIRLTYLLMADWIGVLGTPRGPHQSPAEYSRQAAAQFPQVAREIQELTDLFICARYSPQVITHNQSDIALIRWKALQQITKHIVGIDETLK